VPVNRSRRFREQWTMARSSTQPVLVIDVFLHAMIGFLGFRGFSGFFPILYIEIVMTISM
jgi:hypothetical protein